jgi:hypothetical protein
VGRQRHGTELGLQRLWIELRLLVAVGHLIICLKALVYLNAVTVVLRGRHLVIEVNFLWLDGVIGRVNKC